MKKILLAFLFVLFSFFFTLSGYDVHAEESTGEWILINNYNLTGNNGEEKGFRIVSNYVSYDEVIDGKWGYTDYWLTGYAEYDTSHKTAPLYDYSVGYFYLAIEDIYSDIASYVDAPGDLTCPLTGNVYDATDTVSKPEGFYEPSTSLTWSYLDGGLFKCESFDDKFISGMINFPIGRIYDYEDETLLNEATEYTNLITNDLEYQFYYYTASSFPTESSGGSEEEAKLMINYAEEVNNPIFESDIYSSLITLYSDLRSDLTLLKVSFGDEYYNVNYENEDARFLGFANAYYSNSLGETKYDIVSYLYIPYHFTAHPITKNDSIYVETILIEVNGSSEFDYDTYIDAWNVIDVEGQILKLRSSGSVYTGHDELRDVIYENDNVIFNVSKISTERYGMSKTETYEDSKLLTYCINQNVQFMNNTKATSEVALLSAEEAPVVRQSACLIYTEKKVVVDAVCYGYTFDDHEWFWNDSKISMVNRESEFDLYFAYFNLEVDGEKIEDAVVTSVELTYLEEDRTTSIKTGKYSGGLYDGNTYILSSSMVANSSEIKEQTVYNKEYSFFYFDDLSINFAAFTLTFENLFQVNEVKYQGIWNLTDSDWSNELTNSTDYDASHHSGYTYGIHYGSDVGYDRTTVTTSLGKIQFGAGGGDAIAPIGVYTDVEEVVTDYTYCEIEDFLTIGYTVNDVAYVMEVDESHVEFGGFKPEEEAPVINDPITPGDILDDIVPDDAKDAFDSLLKVISLLLVTILVVTIIYAVSKYILDPIYKYFKRKR